VSPEYQPSGLGYSGGYNFGGGLGGHGSSSDNSLESSFGSGGGVLDFGHHHYMPHHVMGQGKQPNPKSIALKGLLVPLAGVALLGKINTLCSVTQIKFIITVAMFMLSLINCGQPDRAVNVMVYYCKVMRSCPTPHMQTLSVINNLKTLNTRISSLLNLSDLFQVSQI
jgi:hypothetical protein